MGTFEAAQFLASSLRLGGSPDMLESPEGVLDRALQKAIETGKAPSWLQNHLHFAKTRVGLRCVELEDILAEAQGLGLTESPNPRYVKIKLLAGTELAEQLIQDVLHMDLEQARAFGAVLYSFLQKEQTAESTSSASDA